MMQEDLKMDSSTWARAGERGTPDSGISFGFGRSPPPNLSIGKYEESDIHRSRQYWGSTEDRSSSSASTARSEASSAPFSPQTSPPQQQYPPAREPSYGGPHYESQSGGYAAQPQHSSSGYAPNYVAAPAYGGQPQDQPYQTQGSRHGYNNQNDVPRTAHNYDGRTNPNPAHPRQRYLSHHLPIWGPD